MHGVVNRPGDTHRHLQIGELFARRPAITRCFFHGVRQARPLRRPGSGQFVREPGRAAGAHAGDGRVQPDLAQLLRGVAGGLCGRRAVGFAGPRREGGQDGNALVGVLERPVGRDRRAQGHPTDHDRTVLRGGVECLEITADQTAWQRSWRDHDGTGFEQGATERPADVIVVRSRAGQEYRGHPLQVGRHPSMVPGG